MIFSPLGVVRRCTKKQKNKKISNALLILCNTGLRRLLRLATYLSFFTPYNVEARTDIDLDFLKVQYSGDGMLAMRDLRVDHQGSSNDALTLGILVLRRRRRVNFKTWVPARWVFRHFHFGASNPARS